MSASQDAVVTAWREQAPRLIGALLRITGDLDLAQDSANDAMVAALEQWPETGVPQNPAAWLMTVARRRAIDELRHTERHHRAEDAVGQQLRLQEGQVQDMQIDPIQDDVLRLMMMTCHPALTTESQVALTLRLVAGLTSAEIARSFMVPEATVVRRITRAKTTLAEVARQLPVDLPASQHSPWGGQPFDVPQENERRERVPAVLHVIYLIFTEGYSASAGETLLRPALCEEAIRLGRLLAQLFDDEPETAGLLALMYLQSSRSVARTDAAGDPVLLADQDRARWDQLAIRRGSAALQLAMTAGAGGYYTLQAAIAACHTSAASIEETDWDTITRLYDALADLSTSAAVLLNRAVAHGMAHGPQVGLRLVEDLADLPGLRGSHQLPSVRGDLLAKLGRTAEARAEFEYAAALARNGREKNFLQRRAQSLRGVE
ncbi:RNA polymerase sigma factor (sigma-70 family) [Nakamurella sp. UYEF19]|uniref:RNA polymerase sigma factor n=1 Tax=Nakamurella sp. UYEF19 TaxID=1756392 RepID=UPI00339433DF